MAKFSAGEVVIFAEADKQHNHLIGEECEIIRLLDDSYTSYQSPQFYELSLRGVDGFRVGCAEDCLRKKKPPEEASWEEIQRWAKWNPTKQGEEV